MKVVGRVLVAEDGYGAGTVKNAPPESRSFAALPGFVLCLCLLFPAAVFAGPWADRAQVTTTQKDCLDLLDSLSKEKESADTLLARGMVCHNLARLQPAKWAPEAAALLKPLAAGDPLAQAWYGSALTLQGGLAQTNKDLVQATALTDEGLKLIDKAVERSPDSQAIRTLRLENGLQVSKDSPFKRWDKVRADLDWFARQSGLDKDTQAQVAWWSGELALGSNRINEALKHFDRAIRLAPASQAAVLARRSLAELEE